MGFFSKEKLNFIGNVYDTEENQYELYESNENMTKQTLEMLNKLNINQRKKIILKRGDSIIDPEYSTKIKFDFNKSNDTINKTFIRNFLIFPDNIKALIEKSILTNDMTMYIWSNSYYQSEFIRNSLLITQDIFSNREFIFSLNYDDFWIAITQNIYRTKDKLQGYQRKVEEFLDMFFIEYLSEKYLDDDRQFGEWKNLINNMFNTYFPYLDIESMKNGSIKKLQYDINAFNIKIFDLNIQRKALEKIASELDNDELIRRDYIIKGIFAKKESIENKIINKEEHIKRIKNYI